MVERDSKVTSFFLKRVFIFLIKKTLYITSFSLITLNAGLLFAVAPSNVADTSHNLALSSLPGGYGSTDVTEICVFCHTPHNAILNYPLWNRYSTVERSFTLYSSHTLDATMPGNLAADSVSRLCLSCHDGVTAINALVNYGSFGHKPTMGGDGNYLSSAEGNTANLGTSLRDDHPVGFDYEDAWSKDGKLHPIAQVKAGGLKFFGTDGNMLECPTCHDPHVDYDEIRGFGFYAGESVGDSRYKPFLRKVNQSSQLCFTCHNK